MIRYKHLYQEIIMNESLGIYRNTIFGTIVLIG